MLYRVKHGAVLDMSTAKATVISHRNYTIAVLKVQRESGEICRTVGISKYNPNDDVVSVLVKGEERRVKISMRSYSFGVDVALGRALAALRKGQFENYSVETLRGIPDSLVNKVFIKTREDAEFLKAQQSAIDNKKDMEVLV